MPTQLEDLRGKLRKKHEDIKGLFESKRIPGGGFEKWSPEEESNYTAWSAEAEAVGQEVQTLQVMDAADKKSKAVLAELDVVRRPAPFADGFGLMDQGSALGGGSPLSGHGTAADLIAKMLGEHPDMVGYRSTYPRQIKLKDFDMVAALREEKAVMTTAAGFAPRPARTGRLVNFPLRRMVISDLIPSDPTGESAVVYMEETTFTNSAAPVAEGAVKPESANLWTERSVPVQVIATVIPVTDQQLEDVPQVEQVIRNRGTTMLLLAEENQILNGTGTSPQLTGILTRPGLQTTAVAVAPDDRLIAVLRALTLVRVNSFSEPDGIVLHPNDWTDMRTMREGGTTGAYLFGPPNDAGPPNLWGIPYVLTTAMTENTVLVGAFAEGAHISRRRGIQIDIGYKNDDFIRNQRTIRIEERLCVEVVRPSAFATVTAA